MNPRDLVLEPMLLLCLSLFGVSFAAACAYMTA